MIDIEKVREALIYLGRLVKNNYLWEHYIVVKQALTELDRLQKQPDKTLEVVKILEEQAFRKRVEEKIAVLKEWKAGHEKVASSTADQKQFDYEMKESYELRDKIELLTDLLGGK